MSAKSDFLENAILNYIFNGAAMPTLASGLYLALYTTATDDAGGGTEVTGGSYARVNLARNTTNFPTASGTAGSISNGALISFPQATAAWGTITHFAIHDASSGGNRLYHGALTSSVAIASGDIFNIAASALAITEA